MENNSIKPLFLLNVSAVLHKLVSQHFMDDVTPFTAAWLALHSELE